MYPPKSPNSQFSDPFYFFIFRLVHPLYNHFIAMTGITSHSDVWRWVRETSITALNTNRWNGSNDWNAQHRETGHYQDDNDLTGDSLNLVNPSNIAGWNKHGRPAYMPSEHKNMLGDNNCWYDEPNVPYISPYATCGMDALIGYRGEEQSHTDADAMSHIRGLYCQPPQIDNAHMTRWNSPPLLTQNFSPRKPNNLVNYIDASKPLRNSAYLKGLVRERPYIPNAVPYNSASEWRVDQSLTTTPGNRNVYIYGLSRYTTDKIFCAYVSRFGQVDSLKAMIDDTTGACTRVGFVQFSDVMNSVKCILAFQDCGYIASFAEVSLQYFFYRIINAN